MNIDWISQPIAALSALIIGFIWYGLLFSKQWMQASGMTEEKIKKGMNPLILYGFSFLLAFVITIGLKGQIVDLHQYVAGLQNEVFENTFKHGAYHAFMDSLFFGAVAVLITNSLYDQRNWKYMLINAAYWILTFTVMGGIIGALS